MPPSNLAHIFFDLDHTLWDFEKNSALAFETIFLMRKMPVETPLFLQHYIPINNRYWELYQRNEISKEKLRIGRLEEAFAALKFKISPKEIADLADDYILQLPNSNHLFPGVIPSLEYLSEKYTLHIITNGFSEVQHRKMALAKIDSFFETITTSEEAGVKKPDPIIFAHALKKAKATKEQSLMIGDNLEADVLGALNFGMQALHFSQKPIPNIQVLSHHDELIQLF